MALAEQSRHASPDRCATYDHAETRSIGIERMKSHARVVVMVVGCRLQRPVSLDEARLEGCGARRAKKLTAGSSWHAAGGFHAMNSDPNVARLQAYTISVYKEIEQISGQDVGVRLTGGLNIAATKDRWDFLKADVARHRVLVSTRS